VQTALPLNGVLTARSLTAIGLGSGKFGEFGWSGVLQGERHPILLVHLLRAIRIRALWL
jgi:hypothetical protein